VQQSREEFNGLALALLCGVILGTAVTVSRFAYDGGASGIVVAVCRSAVMSSALFVVVKLMRRSLRLPRKLIALCLVNGVLMGVMTYGNIGAIEFISVGFAALLFFTFPAIIAVLVIVLRIEHVTALKALALGIAFFGLAIMLGASLGNVDHRGVVLSLMGACVTAVNAILVGRYFKQVDPFVISLYFSAVAFVLLLFLALTVAVVRLPVTPGGWGGILGVALLQSVGTPLYFAAIGKIGALKTGIVTNIQPVTSIFEAWALFDEMLGLLQALGGAIVLLSIAFMQWADLRSGGRSKSEL
jgi:drug/metabolite transporter (DMT)-like permease